MAAHRIHWARKEITQTTAKIANVSKKERRTALTIAFLSSFCVSGMHEESGK